MLRKDKNFINREDSSDCLIKQSGEFTHKDALNSLKNIEQLVIDSFNIEKAENDRQTLA